MTSAWIQKGTLYHEEIESPASSSISAANDPEDEATLSNESSEEESETGGYLIHEKKMHHDGRNEIYKEKTHWDSIYKSLYDANVMARSMLMERLGCEFDDDDDDEEPCDAIDEEENVASISSLYWGTADMHPFLSDDPMNVTVSVNRRAPLQRVVRDSQREAKSVERSRKRARRV